MTFTAVEEATESKLPHETVMATASVMPKLDGNAVWRQETDAWWIKRPSGVWTVEDNEQVGARITETLYATRPGKLTPQLVRNVKQFLQWGALSQPASSFDRDPWLLGVNNGIVDLRTGDLVPDDDGVEHYVTKTSPLDFVPGAESSAWLAHIESVFDGDEDVAHCFQKQIGAALVGDAETLKPQVFLQLLGPSGGGKGLATHTLRWVLGSHAASLRAQDFTDGADRHPQWMTRLRGARLAVVEEMKGKTLDVGLLKQLSGGDSVVANEMRMADKEWVPTHTLIFTSNTAPDFGNDPDGMRRRYVPLPTGPERWGDDMDGTYARRLRVDAKGILTWCLEGTKMWLEEDGGGLIALPTRVTNLRDAHISGHNEAEQFIAECMDVYDPEIDSEEMRGMFKCHRSTVRAWFQQWLAQQSGTTVVLDQKDARLMKLFNALDQAKGIEPGQPTISGKKDRGWSGAMLIERDEHGQIIR